MKKNFLILILSFGIVANLHSFVVVDMVLTALEEGQYYAQKIREEFQWINTLKNYANTYEQLKNQLESLKNLDGSFFEKATQALKIVQNTEKIVKNQIITYSRIVAEGVNLVFETEKVFSETKNKYQKLANADLTTILIEMEGEKITEFSNDLRDVLDDAMIKRLRKYTKVREVNILKQSIEDYKKIKEDYDTILNESEENLTKATDEATKKIEEAKESIENNMEQGAITESDNELQATIKSDANAKNRESINKLENQVKELEEVQKEGKRLKNLVNIKRDDVEFMINYNEKKIKKLEAEIEEINNEEE